MTKKNVEYLAKEQYELHETPVYNFKINRRTFFSRLGSGIAIAFSVSNSLASSFLNNEGAADDQLNAWIHISEKGRVTIFTGKAEVGQNIRTSLAQIVAEELFVPIENVDMVMGDTALTPYDRGTFGSRSIPYMGPQLRKAAATAREALIDMAAEIWKTDRISLAIRDGNVISTTGKKIPIGELTKGKELIRPIKEDIVVTPIEQWRVAGTSVRKVNGVSFITGKHKFTSDMKLPGMLIGKILRAPAYGATLVSADLSEAKKINGVITVQDGDFIGVAAPDISTANKALKAVKTEWKTITQSSRDEMFQYLKAKAENALKRNIALHPTAGTGASVQHLFTIDYIAHVPLEPRAGVAQWEGNKLTVWTGTQRPFGVQEDLEKVFHLPKTNIRVIQPDTGSGYGGKHTGEAGIEAARLAKEAGKPVKVVWTREEEFAWAYFRPSGVIAVKATTDKEGKLSSWEFHNCNSGSSAIETPYDVKHKKEQFHQTDSPLRQGSYRGLAATANVFARESMMNDLAEDLKTDPLTFRLKNLSEERMKNVLQAAAEKFGWNTYQPSENRGIGIACGNEKGSYVATCAEVQVNPSSDEIKVIRTVTAFECGAIINPEHLKNQIQGAVIQGLGGALFEKIDFNDGKILNGTMSRYRVPRFADIPLVEIVMLNRKDIPSAGAGETPIVAIAPAIRNAITNAGGKRLYTMPLLTN